MFTRWLVVDGWCRIAAAPRSSDYAGFGGLVFAIPDRRDDEVNVAIATERAEVVAATYYRLATDASAGRAAACMSLDEG
jgi:hypothetical protein